jgi:hypothetical protein
MHQPSHGKERDLRGAMTNNENSWQPPVVGITEGTVQAGAG